MAINYIEKGSWLHNEIAAQGYLLKQIDGVWVSNNEVAVQAIIDAFDPLPYAKADKINEIKVEATQRGKSIYLFLDDDTGKAISFYEFGNDIIQVIAPGSRQSLPQNLLDMKAIHDAAAAAIATINAYDTWTDWTAVMAYDVVNTPLWP